MSFKSVVTGLFRGNYNFGRTISRDLTREMSSGNARALGAALDVGAAAGLTYFGLLPMVGALAVAGGAIATAVAFPAAIPAALAIVAKTALSVALGSLTVPLTAGFASAALNKLNIPTPGRVVAETKYAAVRTAQAVARPFKWVGHKLSRAFKTAHDGAGRTPKPAVRRVPPAHRKYDL